MGHDSGEAPGEPPEPWRSFLLALDDRLGGRVDLHCIGGFAITMQFGISRETADLDILASVPGRELARLAEIAGEGSELHRKYRVYVQPVRIVTYPEDYESRLLPMWPRFGLRQLRLFALEPHDLALTKLERNSDVDRQDVLALADRKLIDPETLRDRYRKEYRPNVAAKVETLDLTLKLWVEMCWPADRDG